MTRNKAQKQKIRSRMQETGENYATARNHILNQQKITVWELGEEGDSWYVEGTVDSEEAKLAVKNWLEETTPEYINDDGGWDNYSQRLSTYPSRTYFWKPLHPQHPDDEWVLFNKTLHPEKYTNEPLMQGTHVLDNLDNTNYDN